MSESDPELIQDVHMRRWNFEREHSVAKFRARLTGVHSECELQCSKPQSKLTTSTGPGDDDVLPFGLGRASAKAKRRRAHPRPEPEPEPEQQDGSGSGSDSNVDSQCPEPETESAVHEDVPSCNDGEESDAGGGPDVAESSADPGPGEVSSQSDDHGLKDEAWNSKGLKSFEIAPKGARAKCEICNLRVMPGQLRFDYRYRVSNTLGDQKRIHATCCDRLPADTRLRDIAQLSLWLRTRGDLENMMWPSVWRLRSSSCVMLEQVWTENPIYCHSTIIRTTTTTITAIYYYYDFLKQAKQGRSVD